MKNHNNKQNNESLVSFEGLMTIGKSKNGLHTADFMCCEDVRLEAFSGIFKVQAMRDGNIYINEKPKRVRNRAIFREDNASLSKGQNGRYYFTFSIPEEQLQQLPKKLVVQASSIAQKVIRELMFQG